MLDDLKKIKSGKKETREFGLVIGTFLIVLGAIALWRGKAISYCYLTIGISFAAFGLLAPMALRPLQKAWMAIALVLGFFMSRVILTILYFGVMTPIGLLLKLFGKDVLEEKIDRSSASYWHKRDTAPKPKESYENQF